MLTHDEGKIENEGLQRPEDQAWVLNKAWVIAKTLWLRSEPVDLIRLDGLFQRLQEMDKEEKGI